MLDDDVSARIETAAKAAGVSENQWIADAVRLRMNKEWPDPVRALAGVWPDFPALEEIRSQQELDIRREEL